MTCRIDRLSTDRGVLLRVSGRITGDDLEVLRTALEESRVVAIELAEVELVDRDAVTLLALNEANGIELRHCPAYIREWITREREPQLAPRVLAGTAFSNSSRELAAKEAVMTKLADVVEATAIRPFQVNVPEAELTDLRRRINATRLPEKETVADFSQGVPLATVQKLARYWATEYDWRKVEARLNAAAATSSPRSMGSTSISSMSVRSMRMRCRVIVTHGWPGSIVEQLKLIDPLTNPTAHGGTRGGCLPRGHPVDAGLRLLGQADRPPAGDPTRIARAWIVLMKRLGYSEFVAQGGDWGAIITDMMGVQAPPELLGIHTNMAERDPSRHRRGGLFRRAGASGSLSRREARVRASELRLCKGHRLRLPDGAATADAVRNRGFAGRPGGVFPRSRRAQPGAHRARL